MNIQANQAVIAEALAFRHATKGFDPDRKIDKPVFEAILEAGRLSPSSFGVEPVRFIVVESQTLKEKLRPFMWDQPQITTCSQLVFLTALSSAVKPGSAYVRSQFERWGYPAEMVDNYMGYYAGFHADKNLICWAEKQAYIASGVMMLSAAAMGVDSCPIEGMDYKKVAEILGLNPEERTLAYALAFGYRAGPQQPRFRLPLEKLVEIR